MNDFPDSFLRLPVQPLLQRISDALQDGHALLSTPTGSGKTTCVPLLLRELPCLNGGKILMLEPRRIAARAAAMRMSSLLGEKVGKTVGYRTRFESKVSRETIVEVVTEGILIRQLQNDPELSRVGLVIFDEFHERSLQADLGLALCLDLCQLREELRILVMSATLDSGALCKLLGDATLIEGAGRSFPVTISHLPPVAKERSLVQQVVRGVQHAWDEDEGDILAFLPGAGEIHRSLQMLREKLPEANILPLFGDLNFHEQDKVFKRDSRQRRVILATPIAETSITIDNISCVVDSGYFRRPLFDSSTGLSRLSTHRISRASADQRAGRAGRMKPGTCYRLWNKNIDHGLLDFTPPEILNADLVPVVLELALWGVTDPSQLSWLDVPRSSSWNSAVRLLQRLNLLGERGFITNLGRRVAALPVHPRLGCMLIAGERAGHAWTACLLAACLVDRDPCKGTNGSADIEKRVRLLEGFQRLGGQKQKEGNSQLCQRLLKAAKQWQSILAGPKISQVKYEELGNLLTYAYPDRVALLRKGSYQRYTLATGGGAELLPGDALTGSMLLVVPQVDARQGNGRVFLAARLSLQELRESHDHLLRQVEKVEWDEKNSKVVAAADTMLGRLVLERTSLSNRSSEQITEALIQGILQTGIDCLPWTREVRELQERIGSLLCWLPAQWPDIGDGALIADLDWLRPYLPGMNRLAHLKQLGLKSIFLALLSWEQQVQLEKLAPTHLNVPSGSKIRLQYTAGKAPVLPVRIQELFGLQHTPRICREQIAVTLHLLSPASRPIQITSDLHSFWQNTYPEIKKELAGRYPKHYWPDDPFQAIATSKTKKNMKKL